MKGFLSIKSSLNELKDIGTLTTTGMLMAVAIALRSVAIDITPDIRISFAFIAIIAIAVLFGPVVAGIANISCDFLGYILSNNNVREYSIPLALVTLLAGVIYGLVCYRPYTDDASVKYEMNPARITFVCISRAMVVLVCNICLNSILLYSLYVNKDFNLFTADAEMYNAFWLYLSPRIIKNGIQYAVDIVVISTILPLVIKAYQHVKFSFSGRRKTMAK